jgi:hypothetical protein
MASEAHDWVGIFTAIEAAMTSAANQRSPDLLRRKPSAMA